MKPFNLCKPYLLKHKTSLTLYLSISILVGLFSMVNPLLIGDFIDSLIAGGTMAVVFHFAIVFASINIARTALSYITMILRTKIQTRAAHEFSQDTIGHIQGMSLSFVEKKDSNYFGQVINGDTNMLITFFVGVVHNVVLNGVYFIVPLVVLFYLSPQVTLALMGFLLIYVIVYIKFKKPLFDRSMSLRITQNSYFSKVLEQLKLTKFIKFHALGGLFRRRMDKDFNELIDETLKMQKLRFSYSSLDTAVTTIAQIVLFLMGGYLILYGYFTIGMFTIFSMYFNIMLGAAKYFFDFGKNYQDNIVSYNRLNEIISGPLETQGSKILTSIEKIQIKNLGFSYTNFADADCVNKKIFDNFNLELNKGKIYGIVGHNGAGKSTLIKLMLGMYIDEVNGEICFNDISYKELDMLDLRAKHIGIAEQESVVLNDNIENNIIVDTQVTGPRTASIHVTKNFNESKINLFHKKHVDVLNLAEFLEKIYEIEMDSSSEVINDSLKVGKKDVTKRKDGISENFKNDFNTNFSGGEKQKLSILRLMIKNPSVMIFDEPTSALDAQTSSCFMDYLQQVKRDKIIIVVTHDEYVKRLCDEVLDVGV